MENRRRSPVLIIVLAATVLFAAVALYLALAKSSTSSIVPITAETADVATTSAILTSPTTNAAANPTPAASPKKLGMSLGPVALKMSQAELLKVMGEPQQRTVLHGNGSPEWDYPGLVVGGEPVWLLSAKSPYLAVTAEGFRLGDDKETFQRLYNTSRLNEYKADGDDQLTIQDNNVMLNVHFDSQGRSQAIVLSCVWHNETNSFC